MEGGSNGTSCMMAFGENSNGLCPMMMMPLMTSHHAHHHHQQQQQQQQQHHSLNPNPNPNPNPNGNADTNNISQLFLPLSLPLSLPPTNNHHHHHHHHHQNRHSSTTPSGSSSFNMLENHPNNNNNNPSSAAATPAGCTYFMADHDQNNNSNNDNDNGINISSFKAKIMAHPHYHRLLAAYVNCQKVGAPPEVVARLEEACASAAAAAAMGHVSTGCLGEDPALDQFMEAYCEMLAKYEQELSKPFKEAMLYLQKIECQFKALTFSSSDSGCGEAIDRNGSSEEEVDVNNSLVDPQAEDRELKGQLLRKYSGYLGSLKQEFMKKRKKGKLPKEARQQLLDWWNRHYKWPYPSESQKLALAESTGLDQKQINNWFINQRKRHWKPSEDMQFVVMDATHPHHYYMDNVLGNPFPMDIAPALL